MIQLFIVILSLQPEGDKWAKWWRRMWSGLAMVFGFFGYLHLGRTVGLILLILGVQSRVYKEIVVIQLNISKEK